MDRDDWVVLGAVRRARGIRGEVIVDPFGSKPERFVPGLRVFLAQGGESREAVVERSWSHNGQLVVKFREVPDRTQAEGLRGWEIRIPASERPPAPEGEFYLSDLVGCRLETAEGRLIGEVAAYQDFGPVPLLEVRQGKRELLVPFTEGIYKDVDLENRRIVVELPEGLEDLNAE